MRTPTLLALAASAALLPGAALAQHSAQGGRAGVTWQGGGARAGGGMHVGGGVRVNPGVRMPMPRGGAHMPRPPRGGAHMPRPPHGGWAGGTPPRGGGHGWGGGVQIRRGHFRPGPGFSRRIVRGGFIHPYWFGNQFQINNWQAYGFANPGDDQRWVRYYDDAYLIDRGGRVVDTREGLDWDQYGERWEVEDGVPSYYGSREYTPGDEDYDYAESRRDLDEDYAEERGGHRGGERHHDGDGRRGGHAEGGWDYSAYRETGGAAYGHGGQSGSVTQVYGGGPGYGPGPAPGAVYGGGYGYGYYAYPIIIETTTTHAAAATTYSEEIIEEVIETRRPRRRVRRPCNCAPARPRPPAGERG